MRDDEDVLLSTEHPVYFRWAMTKAEGAPISVDELTQREKANIQGFSFFQLDWDETIIGAEPFDMVVQDIHFIYDGMTPLPHADECGVFISGKKIEGYPTPVVRIELRKPIMASLLNFIIRSSTISLNPHSRRKSGQDPFCFIDYNGWTGPISQELAFEIKDGVTKIGINNYRHISSYQLRDGVCVKALSM